MVLQVWILRDLGLTLMTGELDWTRLTQCLSTSFTAT